MGQRGPAPKPTALRVLEGNRGHRPLNADEPRPVVGPPTRPAHLSGVAAAVWDDVARTMSAVPGWLTSADWTQLEGLAVHYAIWLECLEKMRQEGRTYSVVAMAPDGSEQLLWKSRPENKIANDAWTQLMKCAKELGLSPAQRSRIVLRSLALPDDEIDPA